MSDQINVTICCPLAHLDNAGQLARCIGYSEADERTFSDAPQIEIAGEIYAIPSGLVKLAFVTDAVSPLEAPAWGVDLAAASAAQALIEIWQPPEDPEAPMQPFAKPDRITAVVGLDRDAALAVLGVTGA